MCNFQERRIYGENTNQKIFAQKVTRHGTRGYPPKYAAQGMQNLIVLYKFSNCRICLKMFAAAARIFFKFRARGTVTRVVLVPYLTKIMFWQKMTREAGISMGFQKQSPPVLQ